MSQAKLAGVIAAIAVLLLASVSLFTVDPRQRAILFRLGEIVRTDFTPGLYAMIPVYNNVRKFDARVQTLDAEPEAYLTKENKSVIVDSFVKWRIVDVARYYTATGGDDQRAGQRLRQNIQSGLRSEFGKRSIQEVISGDRAKIMEIMTVNANKVAGELGIEVVDVRLRRVDFPKEVSTSVYQRMEAERSRAAKDFRARGAEAAERIRADADRQRTVTLAEAYREAENLRGQGDAKAADIYAKAYGNDPEFYAFYRSLNAYKNTFSSTKGDMMVLDPGSEFFKYFKTPSGAASGKK